MNTSIRLQMSGFISVLALGVLLVLPTTTEAASCQFSRDLQLGVMAPEVKCLQQFLNANGFIVSDTGAGSAGKETDEYKLLTEKAVIKWQTANGVSPASGYFGSKSRVKYTENMSGEASVKQVLGSSTSTAGAVVSNLATLQEQVNAILAQLAGGKPVVTTPKPLVATPAKSVMDSLKEALDAIDTVETSISDNPKAENINEMKSELEYARKNLVKGLRSMIATDSVKATSLFTTLTSDIKATVLKKTSSTDLDKRLSSLHSSLKSAQKKVDKADNDDAQDYLYDAEDYLDDAEDMIDDSNTTKAKKYLDQAEQAIKDALNEL